MSDDGWLWAFLYVPPRKAIFSTIFSRRCYFPPLSDLLHKLFVVAFKGQQIQWKTSLHDILNGIQSSDALSWTRRFKEMSNINPWRTRQRNDFDSLSFRSQRRKSWKHEKLLSSFLARLQKDFHDQHESRLRRKKEGMFQFQRRN